MSKFFGVLFFIFIVSLHSFAQTQTIKGKIVDEDGKGIANANVVQTGSRKGAQTDKVGNFLLDRITVRVLYKKANDCVHGIHFLQAGHA